MAFGEGTALPRKERGVPPPSARLAGTVIEVRPDGTLLIEAEDGRTLPVSLSGGGEKPAVGEAVVLSVKRAYLVRGPAGARVVFAASREKVKAEKPAAVERPLAPTPGTAYEVSYRDVGGARKNMYGVSVTEGDRSVRRSLDIGEVRERRVLPGDRVSLGESEGGRITIESVSYERPKVVVGRIVSDGDVQYFEVRMPTRSGLVKHKLLLPGVPLDEGSLGRLYALDRESGALSSLTNVRIEELLRGVLPYEDDDEEVPAAAPGARSAKLRTYDEEYLVRLINLGVKEPTEEEGVRRGEIAAEVQALAERYGVPVALLAELDALKAIPSRKFRKGGSDDAAKEAVHTRVDDAMETAIDQEIRAAHTAFDAKGDRLVEDLRDDPERVTMYIDPRGSRDHDDAMSVKENRDGSYEVGVHIADVSRYVAAGSALDRAAREQGSTVYLHDDSVDLFPKLISEHVASLNAGRSRFAFSTICTVRRGEDGALEIVPGSMRYLETAIRVTDGMTYDEANALVDAPDEGLSEGKRKAKRALIVAREFATVLREETGAPRAEDLDEDPDAPLDMEDVVAEHMLLMNRYIASSFGELKSKGQANMRRVASVVEGIYRNHVLRSSEAQERYLDGVVALGIVTEEEKALGFSTVVPLVRDRTNRGVRPDGTELTDAEDANLRKKLDALTEDMYGSATYGTKDEKHFSLGGVTYTHGTSPIRRYPDILAHRTVKFLRALREISLARYDGYASVSEAPQDIPERPDPAQPGQSVEELVRRYLREVIGVEMEEVPPGESVIAAAERATVAVAEALDTSTRQAKVANLAEGAVAALATAERMESVIYRGKKAWRDRPGLPKGPIAIGDGEAIRMPGLMIDFPEKRARIDTDASGKAYVYGTVRISRRQNKALLDYFVPGRIRDRGVTLSVKMELTEKDEKGEWVHPVDLCKGKEGPCRVAYAGTILAVDVAKERLIFKPKPNGRVKRKARAATPARPRRRAKKPSK